MAAKKKSAPTTPTTEQNVEALLREVDDALHYDNLLALWHKWKMPVLGAVVALFAVVAAQEGYGIYMHNKIQKQATAYWQSENKPELLAELSKSGNKGFKLVALLEQASSQATAGQVAEAQAIYTQVAEGGFPAPFRQLALFYSAQLDLQQGQLDSAEEKFTKLNNKKVVYRASALEGLAQVSELKGKNESAISFYEKVLELENVPTSVQRRARARINALKV